MSDKPRKRKVCWLPVILAALLMLGIYVRGYFALGKQSGNYWSADASKQLIVREFDNDGVRRYYWPLGWMESKVRRTEVWHVTAGSRDPIDPFVP